MAKPTGLVTLDSGHDLYGKLAAIVPFTEQDDGPARIIVPGSPDVPTNLSFNDNNEPDEESEAWVQSPSAPAFIMTSTTDARYYEHSAAIIAGYGFSLGLIFTTAASGAIAYPFSFYNSADAANDNLWWQYGILPNQKPRFHVEDNGSAAEYTRSDSGLSASTQYVVLINVSDTAVLTIQTNNASDGDLLDVYEYNSGSPALRRYTFKDTLTGAADEIKIGATQNDTRDNIIACINDTGVEGTNYGTGTTVHDSYRAVADGNNVRIIRKENVPGWGTADRQSLGIDTSNWSWNVGRLGYWSGNHYGNAWVDIYIDNGSELGSAGELATSFPADLDRLAVGYCAEAAARFGKGNVDLFAVFDRALNSTDRTKFYNMRPGGSDEWGLLIQPITYKAFTATCDVTLDASMARFRKEYGAEDVPSVLHPTLGMPLRGRGPGGGF